MDEARARIVYFEAQLDRSGTDIDGDRIAAAMAQNGYSVADDFVAEIEARREKRVQETVRPAFGWGELTMRFGEKLFALA